MAHSGRAAQIVMIEDNRVDRIRATKALASVKLLNELHTYERAEEALDAFANKVVHPDLILLDLNLPGMSGQEFLAEIKKEPKLCQVPVVALTSSEADEDVVSAWGLGVSAYIVKPVDLAGLSQVMQELAEFYFEVVVLPPHDD